MDSITEEKLIYLFKVMSLALLEIREEALESKLKKSYHLADLVHNLPSHLNQALIAPESTTIEEVFDTFEKRAENSGISFWTKKLKESLDFGNDLAPND